ncbi:MAG: hypothetical protein LBQ54_02585 [Planctomycetaceae bacterium]|nr:hypothetical protein [Planctomycetaceae bacterium]
MLELPVKKPDFEGLMIDTSHVKVHPDAAGAVGENRDMERNQRGLHTKIHLAADVRCFHPLAMGGEAACFPSRIASFVRTSDRRD